MNLRFLKILVLIMGVLLVAGFAALVMTVAARMSHRTPTISGSAFTAPPIILPHDAKIEALSTGPERITLDIVLADGTRQLLVIDLQTGRLLGTIPLQQP
ncbi:MAG TPA: DUF6476 family protein [Stellaceae bacterium]|nr:DUF6476 family protein [Stellaceae bacterium]